MIDRLSDGARWLLRRHERIKGYKRGWKSMKHLERYLR